ncbi:hypothetical protein V5799_016815 [Amblyomma americanum]|uniref:Uncharacterized protein n=1 Tax=Amblyomma americanum TaxID=6943 RepID=A0AAQ4F4T1_AMBAM
MAAPTTTIQSGAARLPGDATGAGRRGNAVVVRGLDRRGYQALGLPFDSVKVYRRSARTGGFSATFVFACKTAVLFTLKAYFAFLLLWYIYHLPNLSVDNFPARLLEVSELLLSVAAVAGSESLWSRKSNVAALASRYFEISGGAEQRRRRPGFWQGKFIPVLLFFHALGGISLFFASNICPWTREGLANFTFVEAFSRFFFVNMLALSQAYMAMTIYTLFCIDVQRSMKDIAKELERNHGVLTHEGLSELHWKWEACCQYLGDLSYNFLAFVSAWYCYLFVRAVYLVALISSTVCPASRSALTVQEVAVPLFELTYLAILCIVSDKVKTTLQSPVESLQEMTVSRPTQEVLMHVEVQRFLFRIHKYSTMTLWKLSVWTENALKAFLLVITGLLLLHDKRIRAKLL